MDNGARITAKNAYLATRVAMRASRLLHTQQFEQLIEAEDADTLEVLRELGFEDVDAGVLDSNASLFQVLLKYLLADFLVLYRPLCPGGKAVYRYWLRRFELLNIKAIIRGKLNRESVQEIQPFLLDLKPFAQLDTQALLGAEDVSELLRILEGSQFSHIARQARNVAEHSHETYRLDASLDQSYYTGLLAKVSEARPEDQQALRDLIGQRIDYNNLMWLLRFRFNYQLEAAEAYYLLVGGGRSLSRDLLLQLVGEQDLGGVLERLPPLYHEGLVEADTIMEVEYRLDALRDRQMRRVFSRSPSFVTRTLAYLMMREQDMLKVRSIMRGKQLRLSHEMLRDSIGMGIEPAQGVH